MRIWTLHPQLLDARGLVALWRETLLAQAVLLGRTRGYTRHPQLQRFRATPAPVAAVAAYLRIVQAEATRRGYAFDAARIAAAPAFEATIAATDGQLAYEWQHLRSKLQARDPAWLATLGDAPKVHAHPLFAVAPGPVADWERTAR